MPRRQIKSSEEPRRPARLLVTKFEAQSKIQKQIDEGESLITSEIKSKQELDEAKEKKASWSEFNTELLLRLFDNDVISNEYSSYWSSGMAFVIGRPHYLSEETENFRKSVKEKLTKLKSIFQRLELFPEPIASDSQRLPQQFTRPIKNSKDIFIVHGHNDSVKESVARFIEKLSLNTVILHEKPNKGRTIIEKFEEYSSVAFAVVILTPDDVGSSKDDQANLKPRARQNVMLELGYFLGTLGRTHVCALYSEGVEIPSDIKGVLYIPLDASEAWKLRLSKEIKATGIDIDLNDVI
jgi:predicted nucleotide-binding protein